MSSTYTLYPPGPDTTTTSTSQDRTGQPHGLPSQDPQPFLKLNPFSPQLDSSSSASPALITDTPAESVSTLSVHYQSSEFSEADDPFFGVDFNAVESASPSFLDGNLLQLNGNGSLADSLIGLAAPSDIRHVHQPAPYFPLSPDKSPSLPGGSPNAQTREKAATRGVFPDLSRTSVAPQDLSLSQNPSPTTTSKTNGLQLTPETSNSAESSDDGLTQGATMQSPRVTVSHWDTDTAGASQPLVDQQPQSFGSPAFSASRDDTGRWIPDEVTGHSGLNPSVRSAAQVESVNDLAAQRQLSERNQEVNDWLDRSASLSRSGEPAEEPAVARNHGDDNIPQHEISLGDKTENKPLSGQTYYVETGGQLTQEDVELMRKGRIWEDAPMPFSIYQPDSNSIAYQPETSHAAMERYRRMCRDNDSIVSRAATWGTRRYSLPSIVDAEVQVTGNLLKKLSLSRRDTRRPSILEGLRGLVRKPSVNSSKRSRAEPDDASSFMTESSTERKESQTKLAPPSPKPGWSRKQSVPSINTAFVDVGSKAAAIGAAHTRKSSIGATSTTSPRSPSGLGLSVKKPLNRLRSKSDTSGIVDLWKKTGGPPVSNLGNPKANAPEADEDEDDEDDLFEDGDMKAESDKLIDNIMPNFAGFQQHVLKLNPLLSNANSYLVDRIAHQQCVRYKTLLHSRVKHLQAMAARDCSSGSMCIALGGSANILDSKSDSRNPDPLASRYDGSDGDITPLEGAINQDSFPQDIPMPPTSSLPAEFECQLCFSTKKFQKPSDWTKHVHEDVQPFTCTWERCKEPKMFKRKADWVRHENEGHRRLEWWTCDVDDCRHRCYRRDNFLQHLVREHKFTEPKVKTKAAIKRAGGMDPTWAKVEQCHQETTEHPQNEPCRFCGKTFPSWKKLTVHLAKHMEHISLPVLKLVAKKELDEDTIISPVQEPPPRTLPSTFSAKPEHHHPFGLSPTAPQGLMPRHPSPIGYPNPPQPTQPLGIYPMAHAPGYPAGLYSPNFDDLTHSMAVQAQINMPPVGVSPHHHHQHPHAFQSLNSRAAFPTTLPATSGAYMAAAQQASSGSSYISMAPDIEPFPALSMDALDLGLQGVDPHTQLPYNSGDSGGIMDPSSAGGCGGVPADFQRQQQQQQQQQFTPRGSVSPYGQSPNPGHGGFY